MVTPLYNLPGCPPGGIGIHYRNLCESLVRKGHNVHVIIAIPYNKANKDFHLNGVRITELPLLYPNFITYPLLGFILNLINIEKNILPYWHSYLIFKYLKTINKKNKLDIIEFPNTYGLLFYNIKYKSRNVINRVFTTDKDHTFINNDRLSDYYYRRTLMESFCINNCNLIVVPSHEHKTKISTNYKVNNNNIKVIPLGTTVPNSELIPSDDKNSLNILYVGRFEQRKGIDLLLNAIPVILQKTNKDIKFQIIGKAHNGIDYEKNFYNEHNLSKSSTVEFLGEITGDNLIPFYQNCDIFVAPSRWESFGLIYIEAMSYAKPVVACNTGGAKSIIRNNIDGLLVKTENSMELAKAVLILIADKQKRVTMGENSFSRFTQKYTTERITDSTLEYYNSIVNN